MKRIGILGGVGPEATLELYREILRATPASSDQDHLPCIIIINPQVPDRTEAILGKGPSPVPELTKTSVELERAGADFIVMPCNTAHFCLPEMRAAVGIPVLDMIGLTLEQTKTSFPDGSKIGLLATTGTIESGIYHKLFEPAGYELVTPSRESQEAKVMAAIYGEDGIKAGGYKRPRELLEIAAGELNVAGARAVILGCTEIPIVIKEIAAGIPTINPLALLAREAVRKATE
ncbi:aspartate/glutamate racemase family protein [candidate division KSB1 bacterium]